MAVTYTMLVSFTDNNTNARDFGSDSPNGLTIDSLGNLYGTTQFAGNGYGTVFEIAAGTKTLTKLYIFNTDQTYSQPVGTLTLDASGNLYGTTVGQSGSGVFVLTSGTHQFREVAAAATTTTSGDVYMSGLYVSGNLGTNASNGTAAIYGIDLNASNDAIGSIFKSNLTGSSTAVTGTMPTLAAIGSGSGNSASPHQAEAPLYVRSDSSLYFTMQGDGTTNYPGGIAAYSLNYGYVTQYAYFNTATTGYDSQGGLIADSSDNLYGTTALGGVNDEGAIFKYNTTTHTVSALASFSATTGYTSQSALLMDGAGDLFGTTSSGGANNDGTVFELKAGATAITTLYSFTTATSQYGIESALVADKSGNLYGTTTEGGTAGLGSVFEIQNAGFVACYCTGTLIGAIRGGAEADVAVEQLAIGDTVVTASGAHRRIRWIGTRSYLGRFANANPDVLPICFRAGSLADGVPARDLWVSPKHAMLLDEVLIPAECLVNGVTIIKAERVDEVTYWHVELDSHDVLLAEGAPSESYLDDDNRGMFHNAHTFAERYPKVRRPVEAVYCAPRLEHGYAVQRVRRRLAARAGLGVSALRDLGALRGAVDGCDGLRVWGWAQSLAHPNAPVCLEVVVDGSVVALAYAQGYRADLADVGVGDGCHAYDIVLPQPSLGEVTVRRAADSAALLDARLLVAAA